MKHSPERCFVWYNNPGVLGENNDGELQEMLDTGWQIDGFSSPVVVDSKATTFVSLYKPEEDDEEDDSELE